MHSDFVSAATRGAVAVIDGNVMAINPGEDAKMQMFIWNNIFFSLGFDVRDHYKELGGDAAAFVAPVSTRAWIGTILHRLTSVIKFFSGTSLVRLSCVLAFDI